MHAKGVGVPAGQSGAIHPARWCADFTSAPLMCVVPGTTKSESLEGRQVRANARGLAHVTCIQLRVSSQAITTLIEANVGAQLKQRIDGAIAPNQRSLGILQRPKAPRSVLRPA